jgi:hypothetical protein
VDRDLDGKSDDPGVPLLYAAWDDLAHAALCGRLGKVACAALELRRNLFEAPPRGQYGGWHQYMYKDLRALLGFKVADRYGLRYCGNGKVKACAKALWKGLDKGAKEVARKQGSDPAKWRAPVTKVPFTPVPLIDIQYTNRPSGIHQVMQFAP